LLEHEKVFGQDGLPLSWQGNRVTDETKFRAYLAASVRSRLHDAEERDRFVADMRALVSSDMETSVLEALLLSEPEKEPWEVGEAIAECVLADAGAKWPSHTDRDKRTPKASLPGADIVGFIGEGEDVRIALGEVKTSGQLESPPSVMTGRSGMIHQLDDLARRVDIHHCLIKWLRPRCVNTPLWPLFQAGVRRYLASGGRDIALFGLLMRDTQPNQLDLENRAAALAGSISSPTVVMLAAWYLPLPIDRWVEAVGRAG